MDVIVSQSDGNDLQKNKKNKKNKNKSFSCGSLFAISVKADNTTITTITIPKRNVNLTLTTACTNKPLPVRLYVASSASGGSFLCLASLQNQKPMVQMGIQFTDSIQLKAEPIKSYSSDSHLFVNIFGTIQPISSPPLSLPSTTKITTTSDKNDGDVNDGTTKKRKLNQVDKNDDGNDNLEKKSSTENNNQNNDKNDNELPLKLSKKERKRLAKQKEKLSSQEEQLLKM